MSRKKSMSHSTRRNFSRDWPGRTLCGHDLLSSKAVLLVETDENEAAIPDVSGSQLIQKFFR
jgi:hypothetical protein